MSYFMVHLHIAQRLLRRMPDMARPQAFWAGSLAPDARALRPGAQRSDKAASHFSVGGEAWGFFTNYEPWLEHAAQAIRQRVDSASDCFLLGCFAHVYTDIRTSERLWGPIRQTGDAHALQAYFQDCYEIDSRLLHTLDDVPALWQTLANGACEGLRDLFDAPDLAKLVATARDEIYHDRWPNPSHVFEQISPEGMEAFMTAVVEEFWAHTGGIGWLRSCDGGGLLA